MKVYFATLELQGPLFFSSEVKHALTERTHLLSATKAIISSIPLTYALNNVPSEAYAWPASKGPTYSMLKKLVKRRFSYAATPSRVRYKRFFFSLRGMSWGEYRGRPKVNAPRMVTLVALVPPSTFRTVVVSSEALPRTIYIRLGSKRSGIMKVRLEEAEVRESDSRTLTVPIEMKMLETIGCRVKSFVSMLTTFSGESVGIATVEGCKVVKACSGIRCSAIALP